MTFSHRYTENFQFAWEFYFQKPPLIFLKAKHAFVMVIYLPPSLSSKLTLFLLCSVMPGLRFCKLLFPNSHAHCLPIRFCQWSVLMADWKEEGTSGCQLLSTASPPSSSLQLLSIFPAHHHIPRGTNIHWSHLSWWSDLRLSSTPSATWAGALWSASTKRSKSQPAWDLFFTLPGSGNPTSFFLFSQPSCGNCLQLIISSPRGTGSNDKYLGYLVVPFHLTSMYPILCIEPALLEILSMALFFCSFYTVANKMLSTSHPQHFGIFSISFPTTRVMFLIQENQWLNSGLGAGRGQG